MGSQNNKPQFVKVLLPEFLKKLPIPNPMAQLLSKGRSETATLFSPLGKFWHVSLRRDGDDVMHFGSGWREFSQAHNLLAGYFVAFRYEGNMVFKVKVFDTSGYRKLYDKIVHGIAEEIPVEARDEELDEVVTVDDQQNRRKSPRLNSRGSRRLRGNGELHAPPGFPAKHKSPEKNSSRNCLPNFEKIIKRYNFTCCRMTVPKEFCASNGLLRKEELVLKDPKERLWPVKLWHGESGIRISKGWMDFSVGNNLEEGDQCIFQLVSGEVLQVSIRKRRKRRA